MCSRKSATIACAALVAVLIALFAIAPRVRAEDKRLSIYTPQTSYGVSVMDANGQEYVGLVDLLEPLGRVEARAEGKKWKLSFTPNGTTKTVELQFQDGKKKGKLHGADFELPANFVLSSERGYVPLSSLGNLLPRVLDLTAQLRLPSRRLFLGGTGVKFTAELRKNPSRLVLSFPVPVSPSIATEQGKIRLSFIRDAVVSSGADTVTYGDLLVSSTALSENNGAAEYVVNVTSPVLATFSEGNKVITIAAVPASASAAPAPPATPPTPLPPPNYTSPARTTVPSAPARPTVIIDASHGGDERGAALAETIAEKDVTLAFARRLYRELENKGITAQLIRTTDSTLTLEQRAQAANASRAYIYVAVHAAALGSGLRIYTALMQPAAMDAAKARRSFLPWDTAQAPFLDASGQVAGSIASELNARQLAVRALNAPLRPLNNIASAAVAIEIAPANGNVESIADAKYQQNLAVAVAAGIAAVRPKLEAAQ